MRPSGAYRIGACPLPWAVLALTLALAGCASSSGTGYASSAGGDQSASQRAAAAKARTPAPAAAPATAPAAAASPSQGGEATGGGLFSLFFSAPEQEAPADVGYLILHGLGSGAEVFIDGEFQSGSSLTLASGEHQLRVRSFGYLDFDSPISITQGSTLELSVSLQPAAFALESVSARPQRFDPADPGFLGSCEISVDATAAGAADLLVEDAEGREVRHFPPLSLASFSTSLRWDGRDDRGHALQPGIYTLSARAASGAAAGTAAVGAAPTAAAGGPPGSGAAGASAGSRETQVTIVSGRYARSSTFYSGVSGALLAPDARSLERGEVESGVDALGHLELLDHAIMGRGTLDAGIRVGLPSPSGGMELEISALSTLYPGDMSSPSPDSWTATAAFKYAFVEGESGGVAAYAKLSLASFMDEASSGWPPAWDGPTRYAGLSAGMPFELSAGGARLFVTPEIETSTFYPGYDDGLWTVPGFFVWAYLRAGLEVTMEAVSFAVSAAAKSEPFSGGPPLERLPLAFGAELRWHLPNAPFSIAALATGEFWGQRDYYVSAGLGADLRF
ncbi:MAG TPA: FlgD immunoglobulin-like domain containing protein [Rectinemataceae bacterium]|nr:FlgD immunoglobulin-like domain containing protein [Rectinemataceae bacterium]